MAEKPVVTKRGTIIHDPPIARFLFSDTRAGWIWLPIRLILGWSWLEPGLEKINNPAWTQTGEALRGFWTQAVQIPESGRPPITFDWYRNFIQSLLDAQAYTWFAKVIAYGETLIGIALIVGAFVGIAAFFGAVMNWNYIMAGSASSNGLLGLLAVLLILAWKVAGWYGLDRWLLRWFGTPWDEEPKNAVEAEAVRREMPVVR
jgi:thiosulfate dehydrogenase (quinone) large subunit